MEILEALDTLDIDNDEQWTADGLPKVDAVAALVGNDALKRSDIIEAAPDFNRTIKVGGQDPNPELKDAAGKVIGPDDEVAGPASTLIPGVDVFPEDGQPVPPVDGAFVFDADSDLTEEEQKAVYDAATATPDESKDVSVTDQFSKKDEPPKFKTTLEEVEYAFVEAQNELNDIAKEESKLKKLRVELELKCGYLGGQVGKLKKSTGQNEQAIQQYLANNRKIATEKAEARKKLLESGFADVLKSVGPVALDAALKQRKPLPSNVRRQYPSAITPD